LAGPGPGATVQPEAPPAVDGLGEVVAERPPVP
jgi:hypothetical protein